MNDRQIKCFIQASTYLNFHKAAEALFLSQPAMTYQIHSLEDELGFPLFNRINNHVILTPAGESFYRDCLEMSTTMQKALAKARQFSTPTQAHWNIAWPPAIFSRGEMVALVESYRETQERLVDFDIVVAEQKDSIKMLEEHDADIIFTLAEDISQYPDYEYQPLFNAKTACLMSQSHPLASRKSVTWELLSTQTILLAPREFYPPTYSSTLSSVREHVPIRNVQFMDTLSAIDINIASGRGVGIRPIKCDRLYTPMEHMVAIPFQPEVNVEVSIAYHKEAGLTEKRNFALFAKRFFLRN